MTAADPIVRACRHDLALVPGLAPALSELGRRSGERVWLGRALAVDPGAVAAWINLGALATGAGDRRALVALARALALAPDAAAAWFNLGVARGLAPDAAAPYRRVLALEPAAVDAAVNLADALRSGDPLLAAVAAYRRALALDPADPHVVESLAFCLHYDPDAGSPEIFRLNRRWGALVAAAPAPPHGNDPDPDRRLRVGYLSADLYDHPVGRNLVGLIEHHDPRAVEACIYALRDGADAITDRIRAGARLWRASAGLDDPALARLMRADRLDLLVVLAGHTPHNRLAVAALRPAPVQVAMHDFASSGLAAIDAVLGDAGLMPEGGEEGFVEEVVRLPSFYLHDPLPDVPIAPAADGDRLLLGSCSNPAKLNDRVIGVWAGILRRLPGARLLLKYRDRFGDPRVRRRWLARMAAAGIGPERLLFVTGEEAMADHLGVVGTLDVALDPFPFNGCTTTYEALWMGVPVVTLAGSRFVGRAGAAMLGEVGLGDLVAAGEAAYVEAVLRLASDPARRARLRAELRPRLRASALLDAPGHARAVEAAYRRLWRGWCRRMTKERKPAG